MHRELQIALRNVIQIHKALKVILGRKLNLSSFPLFKCLKLKKFKLSFIVKGNKYQILTALLFKCCFLSVENKED